MRNTLLIGIVFFMLSCSTTSPFIDYSGEVSVVGLEANIISASKFFNEQSIEKATSDNLVDERGQHYLNVVLDGYYTQTGNFAYGENSNTGLFFEITEIRIRPGYFTVNFVDPGPLFRIYMDVNIYKDGVFILEETYKERVNMASVVNERKFFNWLTDEERNNVDNQVATLERGLRGLYRDLYFKHLDISLSL